MQPAAQETPDESVQKRVAGALQAHEHLTITFPDDPASCSTSPRQALLESTEVSGRGLEVPTHDAPGTETLPPCSAKGYYKLTPHKVELAHVMVPLHSQSTPAPKDVPASARPPP